MEIILGAILILLGIIGSRIEFQNNKMISLMERYLKLEEYYADKIKREEIEEENEDYEWNNMMRKQADNINTIRNLVINYVSELKKNKNNNLNKEK